MNNYIGGFINNDLINSEISKNNLILEPTIDYVQFFENKRCNENDPLKIKLYDDILSRHINDKSLKNITDSEIKKELEKHIIDIFKSKKKLKEF